MALTRAQLEIATMGAGFRPKDVSDKITNMRPQAKPLLTMLSGLGRVTVSDYEFKMNVQSADPNYVTVTVAPSTGGLAATQCRVSTTDIKYVRVGTSIRSAWNEYALVTVVDYTTGDITFSEDVSAQIALADKLVLGSHGSEELSDRPTAVTRTPDQITNYVETLRDACGLSRHAANTRFYGGDRYFHDRDMMYFEHGRQINRQLIIGEALDGTQNSNKLYKTAGLLGLISSNTHDFSSAGVGWVSMRTAMTQDIRYQTSSKLWLVCGRTVAQYIETALRADALPNGYDEVTKGIDLMWFGMCGKKVYLVIEDSLEGALNNIAILVDPASLEIVTTKDQRTGTRQWMMESIIGPDKSSTGADGTVIEVKTDFGLKIDGEQRCAIWYGMNAVTA